MPSKNDRIAESILALAGEVHQTHIVMKEGLNRLAKSIEVLGATPKSRVRFDWAVGPVTNKPSINT